MDDEQLGTFVSWDYVVFACLFVVSSGIGVFFAVKERKNPSSEFLVGGRQMTCGPVALSLTASFMSAVTVLGAPSDVYRFGGSFVLFGVAYTFVVIATAELFVPVFYRSGITSTYEYLEIRFCKGVRMAATLIYILQTILYTGVVVFAPALALNQVTGFNLWGSIFATGIVCTFYCTLGGLKAVVWTDAFQMVVMVVGFMTVLVQGTRKTGGAASVWEVAKNGNRLDIFEVSCVEQDSVTAPDQLMPYFVMEILGDYPGLPGLFVACAFSGTLSTVAASINALATVTYEDFVKQCCTNLSNKASGWISKGLCIVFGVACTTMAIAASYMGGVVQAALSIHGMCGGPMLGLFSLGIIFPWTNSMGAAGGLIVGIALSFWAGVGAFIYPALDINSRPLSLSIEGCLQAILWTTGYCNSSVFHRSSLADHWYSMSYLYYSAVGFLATVTAGLLISFITGHTRSQDVKPWLLRPVCNLFCFWSKKYKKMCWCGVHHELKQDLVSQTTSGNINQIKFDSSHEPEYNQCSPNTTGVARIQPV
uniref:Solute carrier family 5 member 12 n=1 Tax=Oncorhynchus kisutch TaxID=8019 RepID=A0A8C7GFZ6_ONCKI